MAVHEAGDISTPRNSGQSSTDQELESKGKKQTSFILYEPLCSLYIFIFQLHHHMAVHATGDISITRINFMSLPSL